MALIAARLNAGHSGGDGVGIGIYSPSSPTSILPPPFSPSLISLMVSVDVKHHVYLLTVTTRMTPALGWACSDESHFNVPLIVRDKVTKQCEKESFCLTSTETRLFIRDGDRGEGKKE